MIHWSKKTKDPCDVSVLKEVNSFLNSIRKTLPHSTDPKVDDYNNLICNLAKGKRVLDIGLCEHTRERIASTHWKHKALAAASDYIVGVDIDEELVTYIQSLGFNARVADATGDADLGEKFDLVVIGDVIEHVENPVGLLRFAKRHLNPKGQIIVRTPNAFCYNYVWSVFKNGTDISNLEHLFYVVPTHALELARRTNLVLSRYYTLGRRGKTLLRTVYRYVFCGGFLPDELYTTIFIYIYTLEE